jgi:hypothetical protein
MMRLASELIANADFPAAFAAIVALASVAENIGKLHCAPVYCAWLQAAACQHPLQKRTAKTAFGQSQPPRCG